MTEEIKDFQVDDENMSMEEVLNSSQEESNSIGEDGEIISAKVSNVTKEEVTVDLGMKSEAFIPIAEFDQAGIINVKVGDVISVYLLRKEGRDGAPVVSYKKAKGIQAKKELIQKFQDKIPVDAVVVKSIKGGYIVDIGLEAFMPMSQAPFYFRNDKNTQGKKCKVYVTQFDEKKQNIVVSARIYEEGEREKRKAVLIDAIYPGSKLKGIVKTLTNYGAFIDVGGMDGLLHISDISWSRVEKVEDILSPGQEIDVIVLSFDKENEKLSLGLKQLSGDPWDTIDAKIKVEAIASGKVTALLKMGAIVELMPGVEGFIHVNDISWTKRVRNIGDVLKKGDTVKVKILNIDKVKRQITLGLKQIEQSPWEKIQGRYEKNSLITGVVSTITKFGAFVKLEEGVEGLIHIENMSWTNKKNTKDLLKVGDVVDAVVLNINSQEQKISLGLKQKEQDPFKKYKEGQNHKGVIVYVGEKHIAMKLDDGFEGVIPYSHAGIPREGKLEDVYKKGDTIIAKLIKVEYDTRKLLFSVREYNKEKEKEEIETYLGSKEFTPTLGDMLSKKLKAKLGNNIK
jgi:small subunit ribosomal protein S1